MTGTPDAEIDETAAMTFNSGKRMDEPPPNAGTGLMSANEHKWKYRSTTKNKEYKNHKRHKEGDNQNETRN